MNKLNKSKRGEISKYIFYLILTRRQFLNFPRKTFKKKPNLKENEKIEKMKKKKY